ncbi:PHP domain-containing protein [Planococcus koreensis]|uniref:PHP domain-containing protein n=1 Tax=Planococcus koreensis TaxID=112331 RepID=UPI0039FC547F
MVYPHISTSADLLKSTVRLDELFPFLKQQGTVSAAIVNTKLYGILPFWEACKKAGIHAVAGLSAYIEFDGQEYPVVLYARSNAGYQNLLKITSALSTRDKNSIPEQWLKAYKDGLVCAIPNSIQWTLTDRSDAFRYLQSVFGAECFASVSRPGGNGRNTKKGSWRNAPNSGLPSLPHKNAAICAKKMHLLLKWLPQSAKA